MRGRTWAGLALLLLASCGPSGTFVVVNLQATGTPPAAIRTIDLELTLSGRTATTQVNPGTAITLPSDTVLEIRSGEGVLDVKATLRDAAGAEIGRATGSTAVTRGQTATLTLMFTFSQPPDMAQPPPDMSAPVLQMDNQPSYDFGAVFSGTPSGVHTFTITNTGTAASGALTAAMLGGTNAADFKIFDDRCMGTTLAPQASCGIDVRVESSVAGAKTATLSASGSPGGNVSTMLLADVQVPSGLGFMPMSNDYTGVAVGGFKDFTFMIKNNGGVASGAIALVMSGTHAAQFTVQAAGNTCTGAMLGGGLTCSVTVRFTPAGAAGARMATLTANATPGGPAVAMLTGTAQSPAVLTLTPTPFAFGLVSVGVTVPQTFTVTNTGTQPAGALTAPALSAIVPAADTTFAITGGTCAAGTLLGPVGGGSNTCTIIARAKPSSLGPKSATLSVTAAPGGSPSSALTTTGGNNCLAGAVCQTAVPDPTTVLNTPTDCYFFPNPLVNTFWHKPSNKIFSGHFSSNGFWSFAAGTAGFPAAPDNDTAVPYRRMVHMPATGMVMVTTKDQFFTPANMHFLMTISAAGVFGARLTPVWSDGFAGNCNLISASADEFICFDGTVARHYRTANGSANLTLTKSVTMVPALAAAANGAAHSFGGTFGWDGANYYFASTTGGPSGTMYLVYNAAGAQVGGVVTATGTGNINGIYFDWSIGRYGSHDGFGTRTGTNGFAWLGGSGDDSHCFGPASPYHQ